VLPGRSLLRGVGRVGTSPARGPGPALRAGLGPSARRGASARIRAAKEERELSAPAPAASPSFPADGQRYLEKATSARTPSGSSAA